MNILDYLNICQTRVNHALETFLPSAAEPPCQLHAAMRYAVLNGGKRIRPALVYATGALLNTDPNVLDCAASAIEIIHSYSLIHDDLPAMDDDDLRRGKPTCHKAFDEATAILAGDALQCLAFQILVEFSHPSVTAQQILAMVKTLTYACSSAGMVGGQALDIAATGKIISKENLYELHRRKTGALIQSCIELPLLTQSTLPPAASQTLREFAKTIGIAFQIRDDILDIEGSTELLGKNVGKDSYLEKSTFPSVLGLDQSKQTLATLHQQVQKNLQHLGDKAELLSQLAEYIVTRVN